MRSPRRRPRWALWIAGLGTVLAVVAGGAFVVEQRAVRAIPQTDLLGAAAPATHAGVSGPKNILLVGIDRRASAAPGEPTRSDSIILLHVTADHQHAYLVSLPRDSYVSIPAYGTYRGGKNKINAAFAYGSRGHTGQAALEHGFELLSLTVEKLTGITPDAGAVIDFQGFQQVVQKLGRVCMYVDEDTTSIHVGHTADGRPAVPYALNSDGTVNHKIKGVTANFYARGNHCLTPAQALDFVRQRDLLADHDADYGRQRHQQQFLKAVLSQVVASPAKLPTLLPAIGQAVTVDNGGISLEDWAFAMRKFKPEQVVTLKTNGGQFDSESVPRAGSVQILSPDSLRLLQAVRTDRVGAFAAAHPSWVAT
ncbi:LCP family protein [Paractinoplanes maris]|uniref:LCP family protein n=1 Tax=Paractinoplanes maris TaxID=1734446 RepID=UPI002020B67E|nr:LCP family protein [Actinoplanes maris]